MTKRVIITTIIAILFGLAEDAKAEEFYHSRKDDNNFFQAEEEQDDALTIDPEESILGEEGLLEIPNDEQDISISSHYST